MAIIRFRWRTQLLSNIPRKYSRSCLKVLLSLLGCKGRKEVAVGVDEPGGNWAVHSQQENLFRMIYVRVLLRIE